uniref:C-type lectin domain-containing protein n=2 Tax=Ciona intestinalis TaxID=7719 RepID=H2Y031_CIOIN
MWSSSTTHRKFDCLENCAESWLEVINKCNCCITAVGKDMVVAVKKGMAFDQANKFCGITPLNQINESYIECLLSEQHSSSWKYWIGDLMHYVSHGDLVPRNKTSPPPKQTGVLCSVKVYEPPDPIPENRTFFISKAKASKQDAAMTCMKDGGTLSVIDTRDTFNEIEKFIKKYFGVQFWIGQINESSLGYKNLNYYTDPTTSPSTNMNHCISMIQTSCQYKWMLSNCSEEIHYLCQF